MNSGDSVIQSVSQLLNLEFNAATSRQHKKSISLFSSTHVWHLHQSRIPTLLIKVSTELVELFDEVDSSDELVLEISFSGFKHIRIKTL